MEYFYSENLSTQEKQVMLSAEESRHLRTVLRKRRGDRVQITNGKGLLAEAVVAGEKSKSLICEIHSIQPVPSQPERNIGIALSTIRPNRLDWAVEKLTELGLGSISFFHSQFTSVRTFKANHLHKIAISAMKQSKQCYLPQINAPLPFSDWIQSLPRDHNQVRLLAHLKGSSRSLPDMRFGQQRIIIAVGSEGGFSDEEFDLAVEYGFAPVKIDDHILRTETAAVIAAAQVKMLMGNE